MQMQKLAGHLRLLTWLAACLVLAIPALTSQNNIVAGADGRLIPLVLAMPPFVAVAWGLLQLSSFYNQLAQGRQFTHIAAGGLRRFGWALITAALILLPCRTIALLYDWHGTGLAGIAAALWRPPPLLATALGAIIGLITIVFARILDQATEIAEENASFL